MGFLKEQFRVRAFHRRGSYDLFNGGLLVLLTLLVLPGWHALGGGTRSDISNLLASSYLPAAMGFLIALRYGTVDLSVWASMGLSGVVAAGMIMKGCSPWMALPVGVACGTGVGIINALLLTRIRSRLPGFLVTAVVGILVILSMHAFTDASELVISDDALGGWNTFLDRCFRMSQSAEFQGQLIAPLVTLRMLIVSLAWSLTLVVLLVGDIKTAGWPRPFARWWVRPVSLIVSGSLAGVTGIAWLVDHGSTPVPGRLVDGLTIPIAVVLAGSVLLQGRGRTMLAGICLPLSLLLTQLWEQTIWPLSMMGYSIHLLALGALVLLTQLAFVWGLDNTRIGRLLAWVACAMSLIALGIVAATPLVGSLFAARPFLISLCVWTAALGLLLTSVGMTYRRRKTHDEFTEYDYGLDEDDDEIAAMIDESEKQDGTTL